MGHAGTLDPTASGLLVVVVGRATRLAQFVERAAQALRGDAAAGRRDRDRRRGGGGHRHRRHRGGRSRRRRCGARWPTSRRAPSRCRRRSRRSRWTASAPTGWRGRDGPPSCKPAAVRVHRLEVRRVALPDGGLHAGVLVRDVRPGHRAGRGPRPRHAGAPRRAAARRHRAVARRRGASTLADQTGRSLAAALRPMRELVAHLPAIEVGPELADADRPRREVRGGGAARGAGGGARGGRAAGGGAVPGRAVRPVGGAGRVTASSPRSAPSTACTAATGRCSRRSRGAPRPAAGSSLLVTFDPHPLEVVNPQAAPLLLTTPEEKRLVLAQSPLDRVAFVRVHARAGGVPARAVRAGGAGGALRRGGAGHRLRPRLRAGPGRRRRRSCARSAARDGFAVDVVPAVMADGHPISSTSIRRAVAGGDLAAAAHGLGRPYGVTGAGGAGRGAGPGASGVPTINLAPPHPRKLLPPDGVYAARVSWQGGSARRDGEPRRPADVRRGGARPRGAPVRLRRRASTARR